MSWAVRETETGGEIKIHIYIRTLPATNLRPYTGRHPLRYYGPTCGGSSSYSSSSGGGG